MGRKLQSEIDKKKHEIYDYVKQNILDGVLCAGDKVPEVELANKFDVSRTPVREVLSILHEDNYLDHIHQKGYYVKKYTSEERSNMLNAIMYLDYICADNAMDNLDEKDYLAMEEIIAKIEIAIKFNNFADYTRNQRAFHDVYFNKCKNPVLKRIICDVINNTSEAIIPINEMDEKEVESYTTLLNNQHLDMVKCFRQKDLAGLKEVIFKHW